MEHPTEDQFLHSGANRGLNTFGWGWRESVNSYNAPISGLEVEVTSPAGDTMCWVGASFPPLGISLMPQGSAHFVYVAVILSTDPPDQWLHFKVPKRLTSQSPRGSFSAVAGIVCSKKIRLMELVSSFLLLHPHFHCFSFKASSAVRISWVLASAYSLSGSSDAELLEQGSHISIGSAPRCLKNDPHLTWFSPVSSSPARDDAL